MGSPKGPDQELVKLQKDQLRRVKRKEADARRAESASLRAILGRGGRRLLLSGGVLPALRQQGSAPQSETLGG